MYNFITLVFCTKITICNNLFTTLLCTLTSRLAPATCPLATGAHTVGWGQPVHHTQHNTSEIYIF